MLTYTQTVDGSGVLLNGAVIPADHANRDYRRYLAEVTAGNSPGPAPELVLSEQQALAKAQVAGEADGLVAERLPLSSDPFVYQLEQSEAEAALAATGPLVEADYPLLAALIDDLGADLDEVAVAVVARHASIVMRVAALHTKRSALFASIDAATTSSAVRSIVTDIDWPADAGDPNPA